MSLYNRVVNLLCFQRSVERADIILVPSRSTQHGLQDRFAVPASRLRRIPYGVEDRFRPLDRAVASRHIARRYNTTEDYLCVVGTIEPRKNLAMLVEAICILRRDREDKAQLLVAGGKGWKSSPLYNQLAASALTEREVKFLGYLPEEDIPYLYAGASLFVFPSLYEGFGFPVLEAMACGAPVVASNVSSIPEIAGDAAVLVDPRRPSDFAEAIWRIRSNPTLREDLVRGGIARAAQFKWSDTARAMLDVFTGIENRQPCASNAGR
jgi:glycosyltransferase involved in cell wall biosynthesis